MAHPDASRSSLIDNPHLERQTMGDRTLADELLGMFVVQIDAAVTELDAASAGRRADIGHSLKGTARSLGVFAVAECAAALESSAFDRMVLDQLASLADQLRAEVELRTSQAG